MDIKEWLSWGLRGKENEKVNWCIEGDINNAWESIKNVKIRLAYIEAKRGEKRVVSKAKASKYEEMCSRQYSK